jgi:hypothetical protein
MIKLQLAGVEVLNVVELPARDPYPVTQIATLHQRETGDVFRLACSPECAGALRMAEGPVTVEVVTRQVELAGKGRAFKLRVVGVVGSGEAP